MKKLFYAGMTGLLLAAGTLTEAGPAMELRVGSGETVLEHYKDYGYNVIILGDVTQLAGYDSIYPHLLAPGSALQKRIEQHRRKFKTMSEQADSLGLAVCLMSDEISLPTVVLEQLRQAGMAGSGRLGIDFDSEIFWTAYRAKYREVLRAWPRAAYVMIRTGENYSHPEEGFSGRTVVDKTIDDAYFKNMRRLIEETRKVVVDEFGRTLIWRTWDLGNDGFHANPAVYDRILQGLPSRKGLIFAVKFTQTDFWRYNDFNPMIGRGGVDQIIEFECAREYEGKGAFPDYIGPEHAEAMRRCEAIGVKGVWVWDSGGGWGGPFLKSDMWDRLNVEATTRLAQNPDLSARTLAEAWAAREFGPASAAKVADMLMLSGECVNKFMYIAPYAREHHGWKPSLNLMRDDIIRGEPLKALYEGSKKALPEALQEKAEAVALAKRMRTLFESAHDSIVAERGQAVYDDAHGSLVYLESMTEVVSHYVRGMFLYYHWQETGDATEAGKARVELLAWREAWHAYQTGIPKLPGAASPYRSQNTQEAASAKGAMADLCENALKSLPATAGNRVLSATGTAVSRQ